MQDRRSSRDPFARLSNAWWLAFVFATAVLLQCSEARAAIPDGTPLFKWTQVSPEGGTAKEFKLFCLAAGESARLIATTPGTARQYQSTRGQVRNGDSCWLDVVGTDGGFSGSNRITLTCPNCIPILVWPKPVMTVE